MLPARPPLIAHTGQRVGDAERLVIILQRLLEGPCTTDDLLALLSRHEATVAPDTLYRDINRLRRLGYRIPKATRRTGMHYVLESVPFHLPFTVAEIRALARANHIVADVRDPAAAALRTLADRLEDFLRPDLAEMLQPAVGDRQPSTQDKIPADFLDRLERICREGRQIRVDYSPLRGNTRILWLEPLEVSWQEGHHYLVGYDLDKKRRVELRVERLSKPTEQLPAKVHPGRALVQSATYRLYPPLAAAYQPRVGEEIRPDPTMPGVVLVTTPYTSALRLCQRLLRYEQYAEILSPPTLRERMAQILADIARHYGNL